MQQNPYRYSSPTITGVVFVLVLLVLILGAIFVLVHA